MYTSRRRVFIEKLIIVQDVKKFHEILVIWTLINLSIFNNYYDFI